ncbi:tetratricopeptide repeat protein [Alteromonas macleodii]|uniref:TPR repeat n=1 Tax=Alteromonas macleodii TaxID=28108 RepID=A0A6T9Y6G2_ALTMA|nr:tetratricopeptide repeat protein [Alteromonas macleodii]CAB9495448.1 TPR repeat [Alteromonas macleodii]
MNTRLVLIWLLCCFLSACQSTDEQNVASPPTLLNDSLFPSYHLFPVETIDEIFYLGEDAQFFAEKAVHNKSTLQKNVKGLVKAIFDHSDYGMLYRNSANTTADTTFNNRAANCLSLSIMTYALAEHVDLVATFYEVDIPEYWTRREGYSLLNGHINMRVSMPEVNHVTSIGGSWADVDFDPQMLRNYFPRKPVSKNKIVSMYYNNKGADALVANSYTRAYSYFRAAATLTPELQQSWVNLGVLYRMVDAYEQAEMTYKHALSLDDENLTAWENLSILYTHQDRDEEAMQITQMVEAKRKNNPFYHYILGEQAFEAGDIIAAIEHYRKGLKLDNARHEILFGMAKAHHELGDVSEAQRFLERAVKHSPNQQEKQRYSSKLATLASN